MNAIQAHELHSLAGGEELRKLAAADNGPSVSILMPTHRAGSETRQDTIRFANLVKRARVLVGENEALTSVVDAIAEKGSESEFWRQQGHGLAILANASDIHFIRLSHDVEEAVVLDEPFYLKPLVKDQDAHLPFYLLAITWEAARLFQGNNDSLELVETNDLPTTIDQILLPPDPEDHIQDRSYQAVGNTPSSNTAMYHGQGAGEDQVEGDRRNFMSRIAQLVETEIYQSDRKFVLLSTESVCATFKESIHFDIDLEIRESPAKLSDQDLEQKFHERIQRSLSEAKGQQVAELGDRFGTAMPRGLASDQIEEIVDAAKQGRVDVLLIDDTADVPGMVDEEQQTVRRLQTEGPTVDLLNRAVVAGLQTGATVICVPKNELPGGNSVAAAIYRF